jgi:hypothetical protein
MTLVRELRKNEGDIQQSGSVINSATRTFLVRATTPQGAIGSSGVPGIGSAYSGSLPALLASSKRLVSEGYPDGENPGQFLWELQVGYSYFGGDEQAQPINQLAPEYRDDLCEYAQIIVNVPVVTEREVPVGLSAPPPGGGPPAPAPTGTFYDLVEQKLEVTGTRYTINLNIPATTFDIAAFNTAIRAQGDKIHTIAGGQWWFEGGRAFRRDANVYGITYSWLGEDGNPALTSRFGGGVGDPILAIPARQPFHKYITRSVFQGPTVPGEFALSVVTISERVVDENGWTSLPGLA